MSKQQPAQFINPETPGYFGFAILPNQVHQKSVKKGFEFMLSGLGKSTLINSLFLTDLYPERIIPRAAEKIERTVQIEASTMEIAKQGVNLRLTVVDTPGYVDAINCRDCFKTIISYISEQFECYLHEDSVLNRCHIIDNRVHCSNTLTLKECKILDEIEEHNIKICHLPDTESDGDEDFKEQTRLLKASIPFSVVKSNQLIEAKGKKVRGFFYLWGVVEVENPENSDFLKLTMMLITYDLHYENFHSERLKRGSRKVENGDMNKDQILLEKETELRHVEEMIARMQVQMQMKMQMQGGDGNCGALGHHVLGSTPE
uniref:Septin-type G domain-containing protein n=1 Tax=Chinchilla lanigera TaxID=34839 RepID=A0A8C2UW21_CHILA